MVARLDFDHVQIRYYERVLGDHPSCSSGAPIAIGWNVIQEVLLDIDAYESNKRPSSDVASAATTPSSSSSNNSKGLVMLSKPAREELLLAWGVSSQEIACSIRHSLAIKHQRRRTVTNSEKGYDRWEQVFESASRKIKKRLPKVSGLLPHNHGHKNSTNSNSSSTSSSKTKTAASLFSSSSNNNKNNSSSSSSIITPNKAPQNPPAGILATSPTKIMAAAAPSKPNRSLSPVRPKSRFRSSFSGLKSPFRANNKSSDKDDHQSPGRRNSWSPFPTATSSSADTCSCSTAAGSPPQRGLLLPHEDYDDDDQQDHLDPTASSRTPVTSNREDHRLRLQLPSAPFLNQEDDNDLLSETSSISSYFGTASSVATPSSSAMSRWSDDDDYDDDDYFHHHNHNNDASSRRSLSSVRSVTSEASFAPDDILDCMELEHDADDDDDDYDDDDASSLASDDTSVFSAVSAAVSLGDDHKNEEILGPSRNNKTVLPRSTSSNRNHHFTPSVRAL